MKEVELVGILNLTPDSFSDGGLYFDAGKAFTHAEQMFEDGAAIIDVGAESTRPGAEPISETEEWRRLAPVIGQLLERYPGRISLDSYHPATVRRVAATFGDFILNNVAGFNTLEMIEAAVELQLPAVIISHLPQQFGANIQAAHNTPERISDPQQVVDELLARRAELIEKGVTPETIILDPGIGFGKTKALNQELLMFGDLVPGIDVMIGYSQKRFLGPARMMLETNLNACDIAVNHGAKFLRVHNVAGHARHLGQ